VASLDTWQISHIRRGDLTSEREYPGLGPDPEFLESELLESEFFKAEELDPEAIDTDPSEANIVYALSHGLILKNSGTSVLAGPLVWIAAGTFVFLVAWLFPPKLYEEMFGVSSRMFLDIKTLGFSFGCIAMTVCGLWCGLGGKLHVATGRIMAGTSLQNASVTRMSFLLLMILCNCLSVLLFVRFGGLSAITASLRGDEVLNHGMREMVESSGGSSWVAILMMPSLFVPLAFQMFRSDPKAKWTRTLIIVFFLTFVAAAILTSRRNLLSRPIFGVLLVYLVWPTSRRMTRQQAISILGGAGVFVLAAFLVLAGLRKEFSDPRKLAAEPIRYLITPYNTQAMIQNQEINLPGAHKGYYWTEWIWHFPGISGLLKFESFREGLLGEKAPTGVWERGPILESHGITNSTAIPAFASSWHDFGWLGVCPFFFVGAIGGWSWRGFLRGSAGHLILYQIIAYSFLEWRANLLFPSLLSDYAIIMMITLQCGLFLEGRQGSDLKARTA
jgi:hypothetical protein